MTSWEVRDQGASDVSTEVSDTCWGKARKRDASAVMTAPVPACLNVCEMICGAGLS